MQPFATRDHGAVSFDIFFERVDGGEADPDAVMAVLEPLVVERGDGFLRIATGDGEADVYIGRPSDGAMVNHAAGRIVWDVMYDLAVAGGFVVIPVGCGTCVTDDSMRAQLPERAPEPVVTIRSGADLLAVVERA
jgi:hypothetical protein